MDIEGVLSQVHRLRAGYAEVIAALRAMGLSEAFIMEFLDNGLADDLAEKWVACKAVRILSDVHTPNGALVLVEGHNWKEACDEVRALFPHPLEAEITTPNFATMYCPTCQLDITIWAK